MKRPILLACMLLPLLVTAQDLSLYEREYFVRDGDTLPYRLLYPTRFDVNKSYPVILFLHGAGERGSDNERHLVHGARLFLDSTIRARFPAYVLFPQCAQDDFWAQIDRSRMRPDSLGKFSFKTDAPASPSLALVNALIDSFASTPQVAKNKIYLGGLSMGAMGSFELLWRKPGFFAAAFPICGGGDPAKVDSYARDFPIWIFHGDADPIVPVQASRIMVEALKKAGAKVRYTEYPGVKHNSWNNAFGEPELLPWLFSHYKGKSGD